VEHLDVDGGAGGSGRRFDHAGQPRELLVEVFLWVEAAVDGEPGRAGHDVEAGAGAGLSADHQHRARCLVALDREARALVEQLVRQRGPRDACQITPPVGSAVSIATALGSISSAARRYPEPAVLPVSSSQTK
jgi:hypothetical protein